MKYIFRLLAVLIIWPFKTIFYLFGLFILNFILMIYHLDFNHFIKINKDCFRFYISTYEHEFDINEKFVMFSKTYSTYYKTPKDLLTNNLTKIYHEGK